MSDSASRDTVVAARLAGLLDAAMDAIISVDESQRIVLYNRAAEKIFGWPAQEARGKPLTLLIPERFHASHAAAMRRFAATGVTSPRMSGGAVVYGRRADGDEFPVDASISQVDTPEGKLFTVILRDVSQRVAAECEQARLASRLSALLASAMDGIISVDAGQRIVMYNQAAERIFGWPAVQVMGRPLDILIPQRFRSAHRKHLAHFGDTGVTSRRMGVGGVIAGLRANGQEFPVEASISHLDTEDGKLYTVILRDVTERLRSQEELAAFAAEASAAREQEKARIARELHDDLAQSLASMKMDTRWIRVNFRTDAAGTVERLDALESMLDAGAAATRRIAADLRPAILDDLGLVPALQWLVQSFSERSGIACTLEVDEAFELQEPHATAVFRIAQESLVNVRKHAQAAHVHILLERTVGDVHLHVSDDGVGFSPGAARKPASVGLIGLRERARLLQGQAEIASTPGAGTRIDVRFPEASGRTGRGPRVDAG